jgi:peptidoglycan-associated lipoprotein
VLLSGLLSSCASPRAAKGRGAEAAAPLAAGAGAAGSGSEPSVRGGIAQAVPQLKAIHFAYDRAELGAQDRETLAKNVQWLKEHPEITAQVAGHCDQRGTTEYNLALGQRRAAAVREYYRMLGVAPERVATISYGKERPVCAEMSEACWARNRRAETLAVAPALSRNTVPAAGR